MRSVRALGAVLVLVALGVGIGVGPGARPAGADTAAGFRFASDDFQTSEDQALVRVVVQRTSLPVSRVVVEFRTEPESAAEGTDFQKAAGTLVFDVGTTTASFGVLVRDDAVAEDVRERFAVVLTDRSSWESERATVTIMDDDRPPPATAASSSAVPAPAPVAQVAPAAPTPMASAAPPVSGTPRARGSRPASASMPASTSASGRRRVTVRQSPVTPFELRPVGPAAGAGGGGGTVVDPIVAVAAGLLLARVAAEVWFRTRSLVA